MSLVCEGSFFYNANTASLIAEGVDTHLSSYCLYYFRHRLSSFVVGTTAEIIAFSEAEDNLKIKAIGRQRFKVLSMATERVK